MKFCQIIAENVFFCGGNHFIQKCENFNKIVTKMGNTKKCCYICFKNHLARNCDKIEKINTLQ